MLPRLKIERTRLIAAGGEHGLSGCLSVFNGCESPIDVLTREAIDEFAIGERSLKRNDRHVRAKSFFGVLSDCSCRKRPGASRVDSLPWLSAHILSRRITACGQPSDACTFSSVTPSADVPIAGSVEIARAAGLWSGVRTFGSATHQAASLAFVASS